MAFIIVFPSRPLTLWLQHLLWRWGYIRWKKQTRRKTGIERHREPGLCFFSPKGRRKRSEQREKETKRKKKNKGSLKREMLMQSSCYPT